jgi:hypothetical protein
MQTWEDDDYLDGIAVDAALRLWPTGTAVISNCAPSGSEEDLEVTVAAGAVVIGGTYVTVAGDTVALEAADATHRFDLISISAAGAVVATEGTPAATEDDPAAVPSLPANSVPIAVVRVEPAQTTVPADRLFDRRLLASKPVAYDAVVYNTLYADTIAEVNSAEGVVIDGVLCKDNKVHTAAMADVTGSRANNTSYENETGGDLFVQCYWSAGQSSATNGLAQISVDNSNWQTVGCYYGNNTGAGSLMFMVPKDYFYKIAVTTGGAITLAEWWEWG